ncbi:hypothetical protein, partial [Aquitalea magnusonii]
MSKKLTILSSTLVFIASFPTNSQGSSIYELEISVPTCFSAQDKNEFIFINFSLFYDEQNTG